MAVLLPSLFLSFAVEIPICIAFVVLCPCSLSCEEVISDNQAVLNEENARGVFLNTATGCCS
jgi:hypothetical protein